AWVPGGPHTGLLYLARELFGRTDAGAGYVYLSDGGHFDNLGVYELVRRRCRFIVACDGGQDGGYTFEDLARLIRTCRTDFGVRIEIDTTPLRPGPDGLGKWHAAVGLVRYDDLDPAALPGLLLYVKSSLTGDEPADVLNYRARHGDFPHQSTADQFFTESQFESYRALGYHVASQVFGDAVRDAADATGRVVPRRLFATLRRRWFPPQ